MPDYLTELEKAARRGATGDSYDRSFMLSLISPDRILALVAVVKAAEETERLATSLLGFGCGTLHENDLDLKTLRKALKGIR